jgi:hypothetical protein
MKKVGGRVHSHYDPYYTKENCQSQKSSSHSGNGFTGKKRDVEKVIIINRDIDIGNIERYEITQLKILGNEIKEGSKRKRERLGRKYGRGTGSRE